MSTGRWLRVLALGLAGCLLLAAPVPAEEVRAAVRPPAAPAVAAEPAVWAVRDSDSTLYLFGTVHLRRPGAPWGGPVAQRAMAEAETVWLEVDPGELAPQTAGRLLQAIGFDRGRSLSTRMNPARVQQLQETVAKLGLSMAAVELMKPWLVASVLAMAPMQKAGYAAENGVDRLVAEAATAAGKPISALESGEQQLRYLDGLSEPTQLAMLYEALDQLDGGVDVLQAAEQAWESGDQARLRQLLIEPMAATSPDLYQALFTDRNRRWVDRLVEVLAGSGVDFVAVGAGHLGGEGGIDALLRLRGFGVERVTSEPP